MSDIAGVPAISALALPAPIMAPLAPIETESADDRLVRLWLHGRPAHTIRSYRRHVTNFRAHVGVELRAVTLDMLQAWSDCDELAASPTTRSVAIATIKSLFSFSHRLGFLAFDVAAPLQTPPRADVLAQRIMSVATVRKILRLEKNKRNAALLRVLYASGFRVSEICALRWIDCQERDGGRGQVTCLGKRGKTRSVLLPKTAWFLLDSLRACDSLPQNPVFVSRNKRGHLSPGQVLSIVKAAAKRAGAPETVSPHWFRHAHASHALDAGAPISLVQETLGHSSIATTGRYSHARPGKSSGDYLD